VHLYKEQCAKYKKLTLIITITRIKATNAVVEDLVKMKAKAWSRLMKIS